MRRIPTPRPSLGSGHPLGRPRAVAFALALALSACGGDDKGGTSDVVTPGDTADAVTAGPTLTIIAPSEGTTVAVGTPIDLIATVARGDSPVTDLTTLEVTWTSDTSASPLALTRPNAEGRASATVTLPAGTHRLTATAKAPTSAATSASVTVTVNAPPPAPTVTIAPTTPTTSDELVATATLPANAGDEVTISYRWFVDGADAELRTARVPAARTTRGETWRVVAQAVAPSGLSTSAQAEVLIANTAPSCAGALLLPAAADTAATFTCRCDGRVDPDKDAPADTCDFYDGEALIARPSPTCDLDPAHTTRGMALTCRLTPRDQDAAGPVVTSASATVLNGAPSAPTVTLAPVDPLVLDATGELTCAIATPGLDPDDDPVTHTFAWTVNGQPAGLFALDTPATAATVRAGDLVFSRDGAPSHARRGDELRCLARATDGLTSSEPGLSPALTLDNAPPEVANVMVGAAALPITAASTLTCIPSLAEDADGDPLTYTYRWLVDGLEVATTATLAAPHFAKGDVVRCELTATDGHTSTEAIASKNAALVQNTPPTLTGVTLSPATGRRLDTYTCTPNGYSDLDDDAPTYRYAWKALVDGALVPLSATTATFIPDALPPGATLSCVVTPSDGEAEGAPIESNSATIQNTPPTLESASISPSNPTVTSTLTCTPAGFYDADGDSPEYIVSWTKNAQSLADTGPTLTGAFVKGDQLRCRVVPSDGFAQGEPVLSPAVTIGNTPPSLASVTLTPEAGSLCATYTCTAGALTDPDLSDTVSLAWRWEKNGAATAHTASTWTAPLAAGDTLRCFATPDDGTASGSERASALATADNAPPTLASAAITPAAPGVGMTLTCNPSGYADDCSSPSYTWRWLVDGAPVANATAQTFDTTGRAEGSLVRCEATPHDDLTSGAPVLSPTVALGPGDAVAPTVAVQVSGSTATCAIVTPPQWFSDPSYTYYWSVNGDPEAVGPATRATSSCELLTCRLVVSDARATLSSEPATAQVPLGEGCEDGNDCTAHACDPAGGCAAPLPTSGGVCRHADPCRPTGLCSAGECAAEGNVCTEEPLALAASTQPRVTARPGGAYSVWWHTQDLRMTDGEDSRRNELLSVDRANFASWEHTSDGRPTTRANGDIFALSSASCSTGSGPNPWDYCYIYGNTIDRSGTVSSLTPTVGLSSHVGCGGSPAPTTRALDLGGVRAGVIWSRHRYYSGSCLVSNHNIRLFPYEGEGAGTATTLVTIPPGNTSPWLVPIIELDATTTPPGSNTFALTWVDPNGTTLHARLFTWSAGQLTQGTQRSVTSGGGTVTNPRVTAFLDGTFLVGWSEGTEAWLQRFDETGTPIGVKLRVNDVTTGTQNLTGLATFSDFGFVAVWYDSQADGGGLRAQLFDAAASPDGPAFGINALQTGVQNFGDVAAMDDDTWVVAWHDAQLGRLMTRRYERDGVPSAGVREELAPERTSSDQSAPRAAANAAGLTLVAWETLDLFVGQSTEIAARLFGPDGLPRGPELVVNTTTASTQRRPVVGAGQDRFVVAWESLNEDGNGYGIVARLFDAAGSPLGAPFIVNDTTAGQQQRPSVAMRADGTFIIAWDSGSTDVDVMAKVYDKDGQVRMAEHTLNAHTAGRQDYPSATVHPVSGEFFVTWQSQNQVSSTSGYDIFGRKVALGTTPTTPTLGAELRLNTTSDGDQKFPAAAVSGADALAVCYETPDTGASVDLLCTTFRWGTLQVWSAEAPLARLTTGAQQRVQLTVGAQQQLVAAYDSEGVDLDGRAIALRGLGVNGPPAGPRVMVNRFVNGHQQAPFIVGLPNDRYLVGWQSEGQDGSGLGVYVRAVTLP